MYNGLLHAHSGLRWIALFFILAAIIISFTAKGKPYSAGEKKLALFTLISFHIQLLIGLYLYFTSPKVSFAEGFMKDTLTRFYSVEHIFGMLLAILGQKEKKKPTLNVKQFGFFTLLDY